MLNKTNITSGEHPGGNLNSLSGKGGMKIASRGKSKAIYNNTIDLVS